MLFYKKSIHNYILYILPVFLLVILFSTPVHAAIRYYNVKNYGANGKDKKSDSAAIQKALDQASEDQITVVTIPKGTYYINKTLYIQSNTVLQMSKKAVIRRMDSALGKNMLRPTDSKHKSGNIGGYKLAHDITITGGTWDGGNIKKAKSGTNLIYIGHSTNVTINNITLKNCYAAHAIELAGVKNGVVRNCKISGFRYGSDMFTSEAIQIDTCYKSKSEGKWAPGFKVDKTESKNILIENNTITDYPRGVGVHHSLKGHQITNITIRNNKFKRSSASAQGKCVVGVFLLGVKNASVSNNTFERYSYGAMIKQSRKVTVKNNRFRYNSFGSLIIEGGDKNNGRHTFLVTSDEVGKKEFEFTCGNIKSGTVKTVGYVYHFHKSKKNNLTLKKQLKSNQKIVFYGKDKYNNKYYRTYYVPKKTKKKKSKS